tara:strand:+ start:480 stop:1535 length:1056 start_codon:yes stop_codon:yes gene_type:complete
MVFIVFVMLFTTLHFWYQWSHDVRVPKILKSIDFYPEYVNIEPLKSLKDYLKNPKKYKLCDWYICSSYKPYLPGYSYDDYCSSKAIEILLRSGVRYLELEVFTDNSINNEPIVTVGTEKGNWHNTLNNLSFKECCEIIRNIAFSGSIITNSDDPLFLYLNIKVNNNTKTLDKIADILYKTFDDKLLGKKYSYHRKNVSIEPIYKLMKKIVIISNNIYEKCKLSELINISSDGPFVRRLESKTVLQTYEPQELTDFNRLNMTIVYPSDDSKTPSNFNPEIPWYYGCQFVCMNFKNLDNNMSKYMEKFRYQSFSLKPENLRYTPLTYKAPKKQNPDLHYNALQMKTSFYDYKI